MKKFKNIICLSLVTMLTLPTLAACNSTSNNDSTKTSDNATTTEKTTVNSDLLATPGEVNQYGWLVPNETLKFTVYSGVGEQEKQNTDQKPMNDFLKKYFNVEVEVMVNSLDMDEKLNLMLAAGDYPDVISGMTDPMAEKFIAQKKAWDLKSAVEKNGVNIQEKLGQYFPLLETDSGQLYKLPKFWGENPNVAGLDFACRYDYWKETGLPMYTTLDEYYNVLKTIVANHPTNEAGQKVYAISDNSSNNRNGENLYNAMLAAYGFKNGYKVDKTTGEFTHWMNTPEGLEIAAYINKFYREGLIDPDFLNNNYETWVSKSFNETVVGNIGVWWHAWTGGHEKWAQDTPDTYTTEKRYMNATVNVPGVTEPTYLGSNYIGTYRTIVTNKITDQTKVDELVRYFDWEASNLGSMIVGYGAPGPDNVWDIIDGQWIFKDNTFDSATKNENVHNVKEKNGAGTVWITAPGGLITDDMMDKRVSRVSAYDFWPIKEDGSFLDEGVNISWSNYKATPWNSTLFQVTYDAKNPIATTYQTIQDTLISEWAKIITCNTEDEMNAQFLASQEKLNQLGLKDLTKYNQEQYAANEEKMKK